MKKDLQKGLNFVAKYKLSFKEAEMVSLLIAKPLTGPEIRDHYKDISPQAVNKRLNSLIFKGVVSYDEKEDTRGRVRIYKIDF